MKFIKNNYKLFLFIVAGIFLVVLIKIVLSLKFVQIIRNVQIYNAIYVIIISVLSALAVYSLIIDVLTIYFKQGGIGHKASHNIQKGVKK